MNTKLRLLFTEKCDRNCEGCCNKQYSLKDLPVCSDFSKYVEVMLTGGEPLLFPKRLLTQVSLVREQSPDTKIIVYTAHSDVDIFKKILKAVDGITLTLHEPKDIHGFYKLCRSLAPEEIKDKSLRLNVFSPIEVRFFRNIWKIKENMEWIVDCPVPEGEDFMRLEWY